MSGIAGIFNLDGRPVDPDLIERMAAAMAPRGPDGGGEWIGGCVALAHRALHTTPESLHEKLPLLNETGELCLTWDGRVDNREELRAALEGKGFRLRTDTDAEIVLRAYECWGEQCPEKILGDFAFAIWDARHQQLFCARDILGIKPFYYYADARTFLFGSELSALFADKTVVREPNEGMVGEFLAGCITHREETLYRGVFLLTPAHTLTVRPAALQKRRYWDIDPGREIRYRSDAEYAEQLRGILREAVRCRLRSHARVGAYLSGGLDSSSVVGMCQSLFRSGALPDPGFEVFSLVFPGPRGVLFDESPYIRDMVRMWGLKNTVSPPEEWDFTEYGVSTRQDCGFPFFPTQVNLRRVTGFARDRGFRVLLTGDGGDDWLAGDYYHYADMLRGLRLLELLRQRRCDSRQMRLNPRLTAVRLPPLPLLRLGVKPLLPAWFFRVVRRLLRRDAAAIPRWIRPEFAERIRLVERISAVPSTLRFPTLAQQQIYDNGTSAARAFDTECDERWASQVGIEFRHPLNDSRVVEFALAIPEEQRWRGEHTKFVLRGAVGAFLPACIRMRTTKADGSPVYRKAIEAIGGERFYDSLAAASLGWVDAGRLKQAYERDRRVVPVWYTTAVELWLRHSF